MVQSKNYWPLVCFMIVWIFIKSSMSSSSHEDNGLQSLPVYYKPAYFYVNGNDLNSGYNSHGCHPSYDDQDGDCITGTAGVDYPAYSKVPFTRFQCRNQQYPGYYADPETGCQVFHICEIGGRHHSLLCPNGTLFNQKVLVCDWWYNVDCRLSKYFYSVNDYIYRSPEYESQEYDDQYEYGARFSGAVHVFTEPTRVAHNTVYSRVFEAQRAPINYAGEDHSGPNTHHGNQDSSHYPVDDSFGYDSNSNPSYKNTRQSHSKLNDKKLAKSPKEQI